MALDTTAEIDTPEHIRFRYFLAGPSRRAGAYLIDLVVRGVVLFMLVIVISFVGGPDVDGAKNAGTGLLLLVMFALEWLYYVVFETLWSGRTIGKRLFGVRVVKQGGYPITFIDSVLRNLLRAADFLPLGYALGSVVCAADKRFRRLGDLVAGTIVVIDEATRVRAPLSLSVRPDELAKLPSRVTLTAEEMEALDLFLRRAGALSAAREAELAQMIAPALAARLGVRFDDGAAFLRLVYVRATA